MSFIRFVMAAMICISVSTAQVMIPRLVDHRTESNVEMQNLAVHVSVLGGIARTTYEMTFYNRENRVLEGRFQLPLAEGQEVVEFALEVNGEMRDGVVVEKEKGRVVFEEIVRRGVDPGLLEKSEGNVYKARVYPVPSLGFKRIRITTEQSLVGDERGLCYRLPLDSGTTFKTFSVKVEIATDELRPVPEKEGEELFFKEFHKVWMAEKSLRDYTPKGSLAFIIPEDEDSKNVIAGTASDGNKYFYIRTRFAVDEQKREWSDTVTVLWDRSGSTTSGEISKRLALLEKLLTDHKAIKVIELIPFHITLEKSEYFTTTGKGADSFLEHIRSLHSDGATALGAIDLAEVSSDKVLLISDGINTFGNDSLKRAGKEISVITSGSRANHTYLKTVARNSGGTYINLEQIDVQSAVKLLDIAPVRCIDQVVTKGSARQLYGEIYPDRGIYTLAGKFSGKNAEIELAFASGDNRISSKKFKIAPTSNSPLNGDDIARLWATRKVVHLQAAAGDRRDEIVELAEQFSLVTEHTSLIILETLDDYIRYEIVPPLSLQDDYYAVLKNQRKKEERETVSAVERVLTKLDERISWWERNFSEKRYKKKEKDTSRVVTSSAQTMANTVMDLDEESGIRRLESGRRSLESHERSELAESFEDVENQGYWDNPTQLYITDSDESDAVGMKKSAGGSSRAGGTAIEIKKWKANASYISDIEESKTPFISYLKFKDEYQKSPAFFLDVSDIFFQKGDTSLAIAVLSNLAEMDVENHQLLRALGYRLFEYRQYTKAEIIFRRIAKIRAEEPQSWRDLALTLERLGSYQEAAELYHKVVLGTWDRRFSDVDIIALNELNSLIARHGEHIDESKFDQRLLKNLTQDIRVTLSWDADATDIDLWVIDPTREKCSYKNRKTGIGGFMSHDFTGGYGPEEFVLKDAIPGVYKVKAKYYGSSQQFLTGAVTVKMSLQRDFGRKGQKTEEITLRLTSRRETVEVGQFTVE